MSYQLLFQDTSWEEGLDKLLNILPNIGLQFKKTYYDPKLAKNCSELCDYKDVIINSSALSLLDARRITHVLHVHLNDLVENARAGLYLESSVEDIQEKNSEKELDEHIDLLEQHRYLDLDHDGYEEPYIVTLEKATGKILRIYARYKKEDIEQNEKGKIKINKSSEFFY
jgi:hypothetical protein